MHRWRLVLVVVAALALSGMAVVSAPASEPGQPHPTMLASEGMLPAQVHDAGHEAVVAYQAAIDHPHVLASVPCLCGCIPTLGHASNLECYIESSARGVTRYTSHGLNCLICQRITEDALAGAANGMNPAELHAMIVKKYGS
jgi:hypothetical protein